MVDVKTTYKCVACGMTKTVPADQKAPACCGQVMQKTEPQEPGENKGHTCCGG